MTSPSPRFAVAVVLCCAWLAGCDNETSHLQSGELKPLFIAPSQVAEWSGPDALSAAQRGMAGRFPRYPFGLAAPFLLCGALLLIIGLIGKMKKLALVGVLIALLAAGVAFVTARNLLLQDQESTKTLVPLLEEVDEFNDLVNNIDVLNRLQSLGNKVALEDRDTVMRVLQRGRQKLETALKTERILRENPSFNAGDLEKQFGLTMVKVTEQEIEVGEYADIFNKAVRFDRRV
ncbi:MAG: hypothetical protein O3A00_23680, partial [Planctomycetota bacterium]|nr:hypothetical protein [Planctomycetota bacterium]